MGMGFGSWRGVMSALVCLGRGVCGSEKHDSEVGNLGYSNNCQTLALWAWF